MSDGTADRDPIEMLADSFLARFRRGERPSVEDYAAQHPELAEEIRELLPALVLLEQEKPVAGAAAGTHGSPAAASGPAPRQLGDYVIVREIARGGMGVVYEAIQQSLGRHVALKVLPHHRLADPHQLVRFQREARAAAMLHHTNIVPVFGVGEHEGVHYYAMQYIQGQSLDAVLHEVKRLRGGSPAAPAPGSGHDPALAASVAAELVSGRFSPQSEAPATTESLAPAPPANPGKNSSTTDLGTSPGSSPSASTILGRSGSSYSRSVARIGAQAAEALAYAHHHKLLHRDVKPSNLLLDLQGTVWVTDFGLAKAEGTDGLTHTGDLVGTLRYMAPERFEGQADARSDVYALGLTLYEMLTLEPAFQAEQRARLIEQILHADPPRPRQLDPLIARDLETVVLKAMAKEPADRYRSASELAEDLRRYLTDRPILARRPSLLDRAGKWVRRRPGIAASAVAMLVLAVVGLAVSNALIRREMRRTDDKAEALRRHDYISRVNLAYRECQANNVAQALELLDGCPEDLRGWEWSYVSRQCHLDLQTFHEPGPAVNAVAFSPDGRYLASGTGDFSGGGYFAGGESGDLVVREVATGREVFAHRGLTGSILAVAFSPDGRWVATGQATWAGLHRGDVAQLEFSYRVAMKSDPLPLAVDPAGTLTLWDAATGQERFHKTDPGPLGVSSLAFSPDGRRIIAGYADSDLMVHSRLGYAKVWDAATGDVLIDRIPAPGVGVYSVAFSPDGKQVALAGMGQVAVWDLASRKPVRSLAGHTGVVCAVAFSPDGRYLASGGLDKIIRLWDCATGAELRTYADEACVVGLAFSPDGQRIVSASGNGLKLWSVASDGELATFHCHQHPVTCVAFSPDGAQIASGSSDQTVKLWFATPNLQLTVRRYTGAVRGVAFSPDGHSVASTEMGGILQLWDPATGEELLSFERGGGRGAVAFSPDGRRLATSALSSRVRIWDATSGSKILTLTGTQDPVSPKVAFRPDGRLLAYADNDRSVKVWDATTGRRVHTLHGHSASAYAVAFSPDGHTLASAGDDKTVKLWDVATGQEILTLKGHAAPVRGVAFSPDGRKLASVGGDYHHPGEARIWDSFTGRELAQLQGHTELVSCVAFSPDGRRLATGGDDRTIKLWDTATGQDVFTLRGHTEVISCVAFSPDGRRIVSGSADSTVKVWDLDASRAEVLSRREAVALADSGESFLEMGRRDQAVAAYSRAIQLHPTGPRCWFKRGAAYARLSQWDKAEADFSKAEELNDLAHTPGAWAQLNSDYGVLGAALQQLGQWELAEKVVRRALAVAERLTAASPTDRSYLEELVCNWGRLGQFLWNAGRGRQAEDVVRQAVVVAQRLNADDPNEKRDRHWTALVHQYLGIALYQQGKLEEAIAAYRESIRLTELQPQSTREPDGSMMALQWLGYALYRAGVWQESIEVLEKSCMLQDGIGDCGQWIVMSLAHWKLSHEKELPERERSRHREEARGWLERADQQIVSWGPVRPSSYLRQAIWDFREEARKLMGANGDKK